MTKTNSAYFPYNWTIVKQEANFKSCWILFALKMVICYKKHLTFKVFLMQFKPLISALNL